MPRPKPNLKYGHPISGGAAVGLIQRALADDNGPPQLWWCSFATPTKFVGVVITEEVNGVRAGAAAARLPGVANQIAGTQCSASPVPTDQLSRMERLRNRLLREEDLRREGLL